MAVPLPEALLGNGLLTSKFWSGRASPKTSVPQPCMTTLKSSMWRSLRSLAMIDTDP